MTLVPVTQGSRYTTPERIMAFLAGLMALLVLCVLLFTNLVLTRWAVPALERAAAKGGSELHLRNVHWNPWSNTIHCDSLRLRLDTPEFRALVVADSLSFRGVAWLQTFLGTEPTLDGLEIGNLDCRVLGAEKHAERSSEQRDNTLQTSEAQRLRLGAFIVHHAVIAMRAAIGGVRVDTATGLAIAIRHPGPIAIPPDSRDVAAILAALQLNASLIKTTFPGNGYSLSVDEMRAQPDGLFEARGLAFRPSVDDSQFFAGKQYRSTRFNLRAEGLQIRSWKWGEESNAPHVSVRSIKLDSLRLDILADKRKPADPNPGPATMPNQLLARLEQRLLIDSVAVHEGTLNYAEMFPYDKVPARLHWTGFSVDAQGIANFPKDAAPARITARGRLMGRGDMRLSMTLPCTDTGFSMTYGGTLDTMTLQALNPFLSVSDRIRFTAGRCDSIEYKITIHDGTATGSVRPVYSDLRIEKLNEATKGRGLGEKVQTLIANAFALRHANPESGQFKEGHVHYGHPPSEPFFGFLWKALRAGLAQVVGFSG